MPPRFPTLRLPFIPAPIRAALGLGGLLALLPASLPASAHDLWVDRQGQRHTLNYGHLDGGHAGARQLEYRPETVKEAVCFDAGGRALRTDLVRAYPTVLGGDCAASWFLTSSGYWSKTPYGTLNQAKGEAGMVIDSWLSVESVKRLDAWGEALTRPLTRELEIVPLADPRLLKTGDKLRLAVFLDGRPAAGATVAYFGQPRGVTDADGRVNVRLQRPGPQLIQASLETPHADGRADRLIRGTALQFVIAP